MLKNKVKLLNEYYKSLCQIIETIEFKKDLNKIQQIIEQIEQVTPQPIKQTIKEKYLQKINTQLLEILQDVPLEQQEVQLFSQEDLYSFIDSSLLSTECEKFLAAIKSKYKKSWKIKKVLELMTETKTSSYLNDNVISKSERSGNTTYFKIVEGTMKPVMLSDFAVAIRTNTIAQLSEFKQCLLKHDLDVKYLADLLDQQKQPIDGDDPLWQQIEDKLHRSWGETSYKLNRIFIEKLLAKIQQKKKRIFKDINIHVFLNSLKD